MNKFAKTPLKTSRLHMRKLEKLSPFELKDTLIDLASEYSKESTAIMLNAGRGNPDWIATAPRDAFLTLGRFALGESRRVWSDGDLGGMPALQGSAERFRQWAMKNGTEPGVVQLVRAVDYGIETLGFDPDTWVHELTDGFTGDNYPTPDRMLRCVERVVEAFLAKELCDGRPPKGGFDIFAVEGGTAAMCYIFDSLMQNRLLARGDTVALAVPTFTPYIEIPELDRYSFKVVRIDAGIEKRPDGSHTWQYTDAEIDKLANPKIKVLFLVNPSNPPSTAMRASSLKRLVKVVKAKNPGLMIITDDVYGTFVPGFRSLMAELSENTLTVYSFSKHFGCTGWRLGVIAVHRKNIYDDKIAGLPAKDKAALARRYATISLTPEKIRFVDRLVADSRQVALNHTAGLSLPQQVQMALFALFALTDPDDTYKKQCRRIVNTRLAGLWTGLGLDLPDDPDRAGYYCELDLLVWARRAHGDAFAKYLQKNYEAVDVLFRLAEISGIVLMDGAGFGGTPWSVRVSLANLPTPTYAQIGLRLADAAVAYVEEWKASLTGKPPAKSAGPAGKSKPAKSAKAKRA